MGPCSASREQSPAFTFRTPRCRELKRASQGLGLSEREKQTAARVLRSWVLSQDYRDLAFADLWLESRRYWSEGAKLRALALLAPMTVLSPRMDSTAFATAGSCTRSGVGSHDVSALRHCEPVDARSPQSE